MVKPDYFKFYPEGIKHDINPDDYKSLVHFMNNKLSEFSENIAYINMGKSLTYKETDDLSTNFAAYLQSLGLQKGDRIAIQMPNLLQYPIALFGALKAGLIVVNTNPLYTPDEMKHQFKDSGAKAIVILSNFAYHLEKIISETEIKHVIITGIGDMLGGLKGSIVNFVVKKIKKMVPKYNLPGALTFNSVLQQGKSLTFKPVEIQTDDVAFLQYTGGTTGVSKGAMLTNRNMVANMLQIAEWKSPILKKNEETIITALPLYHIFALTVNCFAMMNVGAKNILITNPRDLKALIKDFKSYPFTVFTGVNTLFNSLLNHQDFNTVDFSKLKVTVAGGMALKIAVAEKWKLETACNIIEGYGLTESSPVLNCNPVVGDIQLGTIGPPLPSTEISIRDEQGKEVPLGEPGEIWAKGPQIMKGYWNRPEETSDVLEDGWLKTGDIGLIKEDGFCKIVDRKKEMVLVSGFNVFPNEVEDALSFHPKIAEVGVIGVPDEKSGEAVKAFIVKKDDSLTENEVIAFAKEHLTGYKRPKYIEFKTELPKSNVGKILRRILKENDLKVNKYNE
jgi:long-chain acyl-CoA synthetase